MIYDIGIIGAGPAGMTAAIYAARAGKSVAIFDQNGFGGQIASTPFLENYPGVDANPGIELVTKMFEQMSQYDNISIMTEEVTGLIRNDENTFDICCDANIFNCKAIIVASGCKHRELELPTSDIYYCATCDGPFFKDKSVIVVGSGNTGATYALELSNYCKEVFICDVADHMLCEQTLQDRISQKKNIRWFPANPIEQVVEADNQLQAVTLKDKTYLRCSAIFAAVGMIPHTDILHHFPNIINDKGFVIADESCITSEPGIFVAGDCRTKKLRQVVTATSDGAVAAVAASNYVDTFISK